MTLVLPPKPQLREWMFTWRNGSITRHHSFPSPESVYSFIKHSKPAEVYASVGYYHDPGNRNMGSKGWMGADLVFDIDYDHIPEIEAAGILDDEDLDMVDSINIAKQHAMRLHTILIQDFGFKEISTRFSGGRGFHFHVRDECILSLGGLARDQISEYVVDKGISIDVPVSRDVSRQMRVPGSKHIKTGLPCLVVQDLEEFEYASIVDEWSKELPAHP